MSRKMPAQKPGRSEQSVGTPREFIRSVCSFLDIEEFTIDLAADKRNRKADLFIDEAEDSLSVDWHKYLSARQWAWLNPPFADIAPWVRKCAEELVCGANIAVLVPASVCTNWWRDYVHDIADVRFPTGRLTFEGHKASYPKDLALLLYSRGRAPEYKPWNWRSE